MKKLLIGSSMFLAACSSRHTYTSMVVYCPSAPVLTIDSVLTVARYAGRLVIVYESNGEVYRSSNSPSCTIRTVKDALVNDE